MDKKFFSVCRNKFGHYRLGKLEKMVKLFEFHAQEEYGSGINIRKICRAVHDLVQHKQMHSRARGTRNFYFIIKARLYLQHRIKEKKETHVLFNYSRFFQIMSVL